jgi:hypothetical protein
MKMPAQRTLYRQRLARSPYLSGVPAYFTVCIKVRDRCSESLGRPRNTTSRVKHPPSSADLDFSSLNRGEAQITPRVARSFRREEVRRRRQSAVPKVPDAVTLPGLSLAPSSRRIYWMYATRTANPPHHDCGDGTCAGMSLTLLTDTPTSAAFTKAFPVNIPSTVAANTAYVGFTAERAGSP